MDSSHNHLQRVAIFGSSSGLGLALTRQLQSHVPGCERLHIARTAHKSLTSEFGPSPRTEALDANVSNEDGQQKALDRLGLFRPERVYYCVGGGPYGEYLEQPWHAHRWAFEVSLLFPSRLVHWALHQNRLTGDPHQVILVGSSVAEDQADAKAASYSSAKHGLLGLWRTIAAERPAVDVRLFSPGYMNTRMLPAGAPVRQRPIWQPEAVAKELLQWSLNQERFSHRKLAVFP